MHTSKKTFILITLVSVLFFSHSCKKDKQDIAATKKAIVENYANIVHASYSDALVTAKILQQKINVFVGNPTNATLNEAKQAWLLAREPYGFTEVYRFYGGPIEDIDPFINSWPLDEAFIDYVVDGTNTDGVIQDTVNYPTINEATLREINQTESEEGVSLGYHAIEFLLWGQDLSASSAGQRPVSDYIGTGSDVKRRGAYLKLAAQLLVDDLEKLADEWAPNQSNYRADFVRANPDQSLRKIMVGMATLSNFELAGERIYVAYENQDQEDEHSCFSDNTHRDIIQNAKGIKDIYYGIYTKVDGTTIKGIGLADLFKVKSNKLHIELEKILAEVETLTLNIHQPFDQAIILEDKRPHILATVKKLQEEGEKIVEIAASIGLIVTIEQ